MEEGHGQFPKRCERVPVEREGTNNSKESSILTILVLTYNIWYERQENIANNKEKKG